MTELRAKGSPTQKLSGERKYCPRCYQQFEGLIEECPDDRVPLRGVDNDPLIGKIFADRYEIQNILGFGGMSIVYKARHRLMDRTVAIKMLHGKLKEDVTALERFKLEAQAASSLNHQNVIGVYDFGVTPEGEPFFVMDCLEGESLRDLIDRKGKVRFERALPIFRQICDGMDAAHKKQIIHRDLKPANVIILKQEDGSESIKLVDFGIAKWMSGSGKQMLHLTQTGEVFGSPIYMSPEQCLGKELDARSDIYALGCLMYETLTGSVPFIGESFLDTMNQQVNATLKPLTDVAPDADIPAQLEQVVLRCLAKDPADRFQSAGEIRDIIAGITVDLLGNTQQQKSFISGILSPTAFKPRKVRMATVVATALGLFLFGIIAFCAIWPGPPGDSGTPLNKMRWQTNMAFATSAIKSGDFARGERFAKTAEGLARQFGDQNARLEATLHAQADLYDKWEGHAEQVERVNAEITSIQSERIEKEFASRMQLLDTLNAPNKSGVSELNTKLRAEAQLPTILSTASNLYGRGHFEEAQTLLSKAIDVETKLLGSSDPSIADLQTKLADCFIQLRKFTEVRPLLVSALCLRKSVAAQYPANYIAALNKLGLFDLDQNDFKNAEPELKESLSQARTLNHNHDLLAICLRSLADFYSQRDQPEESKKLLQEANTLDQGAH